MSDSDLPDLIEEDLPDLISDSESETESEINSIFEIQLNNLLLQRNIFEVQIYDYLVNPYLAVPNDFWEPVKVCLDPYQLSKLNQLSIQDNCLICTNDYSIFRELKCCKNKLCNGCAEQWFSRSVKCPFCIQDLRDFI